MNIGRVLIVKNVTREGPGIVKTVLEEHNVAYDVVNLDAGAEFPNVSTYSALVVLGGPDSANDKTAKMSRELDAVTRAINAGIPYLGICLGLQVLVKAAGGSVVQNPVKEVGFFGPNLSPFQVELNSDGQQDPLFAGLPNVLRVFQLHGETVELTSSMQLLGTGQFCRNQIVRVGTNAYGLQCHFEFTPAMLRTCAEQDPDLKPIGAATLLDQFEDIRTNYAAAGRRLFTNFLTLAGII